MSIRASSRLTRTAAESNASAETALQAAERDDTPLFAGPDPPSVSGSSVSPSPSPPHTPAPPLIPPPPADPSHIDLSDSDGYDTDYSDPVVKTYDLYTSLAEDVFLLQYPMRPKNRPYCEALHTMPLSARFKPKAGLVEIEIPLQVSKNFDQEKARHWGAVQRRTKQEKAREAGRRAGATAEETKRAKIDDDADEIFADFNEAVRNGRVLNTQTLGGKIQPDAPKYMVGVFHRGVPFLHFPPCTDTALLVEVLTSGSADGNKDQLHLTPVRSSLQLRPQCPYIDAEAAQERAATRAQEPAQPWENQARQVHMKVKTGEEAKASTSVPNAQRIEQEDEWTNINWVDQDDDSSWIQFEALRPATDSAKSLACTTGHTEYLDLLSSGR